MRNFALYPRRFAPRRASAFLLGALVLVLLSGAGVLHVQRVRAERAAQAAAYKVTHPAELARVTFAVAGDVIPHQAVRASAQAHSSPGGSASTSPPPENHSGWDYLFAAVADVFRRADFGFVNLETPVAPKSSRGTRPFLFDAPPELLDALQASGIKLVSFANNHVMDQGWDGFAETLTELHEHGILAVGAAPNAQDAWKPVIVEKDGIRIGWLGMTRWLNGNRNPENPDLPHVAFLPYPGGAGGAPGMDEAGALAAVRAARTQCDLLIVSIHWGVEYATEPRPDDVALAHSFLEAGASAVIGHHPHVLQPIETYRTKDGRDGVIVYSLGNFLSNQSRNYVNRLMPDRSGEPRDSIVVNFAVVRRDYGLAGVRVELADFGIMPVWEENNRLAVASGHAIQPCIRPVFIDRELPQVQARFDELTSMGEKISPEERKELLELTKRLELLQHRRELLLQRTGDDYVVPPPPATAAAPACS